VAKHRIRRFVGLGASGVAFACLGAATAFALEPPPLPPLPTTTSVSVSVPTLPVPVPTVPLPTTSTTVPAPLPPAPTLPVPTPTTSTPTVTGVTAPVVATATAPTAGAISTAPTAGGISTRGGDGADSSVGGSSSSGSYGSTPGETGRSSSGARIARVGVAPVAGRRGVVAVRFGLSRASRVVVVVRGPLPDCSRIAQFGVRGRPGMNTFRFTGRVGKRRLPKGTYLIGIRPRTADMTRWVVITVGPRGARPRPRRVVAPALEQCSIPSEATMLRPDGAAGKDLPRGTGPTTTPTGGTRGEQSPAPAPPPIQVLPFAAVEEAVSELPAWLGYLVLSIVAASLLTIIVLVVRFVRASPPGAPTE
jgi:hypothetical protein